MTGLARQVVLVIATISTLVMNYLSNALPLFGNSNGDVSDALPNAFVPAGFTFAVWGPIFLGLLIFAVYQALPSRRGARYDELFWPFLLGNLLNSSWLVAFQSLNFGLSVVVMLALLVSLIWLYLTLNALHLEGSERWALGVPASLYLSWISVATVANVTAWLVSRGYTSGFAGLTPELWSALLLVVAATIGAVMLARRRDVAWALVLLWALYGVYAARPGASTVVTGALIAAALLVVGLLLGLRRTTARA